MSGDTDPRLRLRLPAYYRKKPEMSESMIREGWSYDNDHHELVAPTLASYKGSMTVTIGDGEDGTNSRRDEERAAAHVDAIEALEGLNHVDPIYRK